MRESGDASADGGEDVADDLGLGIEGLDQLLAETGRALAAIRSGSAAGEGEPMEGTGSARDDQVRAVVRAPGQLTALSLDPRLMRLPSEELADDIMVAVNAALTDLRTKAVGAALPADPDALREQLGALHGESIRQMSRFTSAISGAVAEIRLRRG
jgi:hypothetical protein